MQDFIDEAKPTDEADWITMTRAARAITTRAGGRLRGSGHGRRATRAGRWLFEREEVSRR